MSKIAFIGLGVMGGEMAGHLAKAGHDVCVYNRTMAKAEQWVERFRGNAAASPAEAAQGADYVISCVGRDEDLAEVTIGEQGAFNAMHKGALYIDHTTVSAKLSREVAVKAQACGCDYIDAPVSGGQVGAQKGILSIMCGGSAQGFAQAEPIMHCYGKSIVHIGESGAGQLAKMVNQICIAGVVQGLAEALHFAECAGLDSEKLLSAISGGAASSWQMLNRWPTMAKREFDFGFAVDWMRKDLGLVLEEAQRNGAALNLVALVDNYYAQVQTLGGGRNDTSALVRRFDKAAKV
jgi:3-hydroxyisobutyrate dehydrogenase